MREQCEKKEEASGGERGGGGEGTIFCGRGVCLGLADLDNHLPAKVCLSNHS